MFQPAVFFELGRAKALPFEFTIDTTRISTGSTANNQFKLPLLSTGSYSMTVEWGDSTTSVITVYNQAEVTHTYSTTGIYTIKIKGVCIGWAFDNGGDRLKFLSVKTWGILKPMNTTPGGIFRGCANLNLITVEDLLSNIGTSFMMFNGCTNLTYVNRINEWSFMDNLDARTMFFGTKINQPLIIGFSPSTQAMFQNSTFNNSLSIRIGASAISMFYSCSFNQSVANINVDGVTNMSAMFQNATAFNQDISVWNFNKNVTLNNFMTGKTSANYSASNYDAFLNKLVTCVVGTGRTQSSKLLGMGTIKRTSASLSAYNALVSDGWTITDGGLI